MYNTSLGDTGHSNFIHVFGISSCFCVFVALSVFFFFFFFLFMSLLSVCCYGNFAEFLVFCCFCNGDEQAGLSLTWPQTFKTSDYSWLIYSLHPLQHGILCSLHHGCTL